MSWIQSAFGSKISPVILFIIVLLAVVFFICALLHLLIRFILKQRSPQPHISPNHHEVSNSSAFQRQLQQLFHLHDSGLDQAYIDALPVFLYKDIVMGSKEPFDCAVCLCEFSQEDSLRLLPVCSHAFHIGCIDTWLLSNSTCPLCRGVILSFENPVFFFDEFKENEEGMKPREDENTSAVINEKRVFSVRLGKFRSTNNISSSIVEENQENEESEVIGESSNSNINSNRCNIDARRCYSMGSYQYVVADSELQVALCPSGRDRGSVKGRGGGGGQNGHFTSEGDDGIGKKINKGAKGESFSVSKIWMWSRKGKFHSSTEATRHYPNAIDVSLP